MLNNLPFLGNFPIIQSFGDNSDFYREASLDGVVQKGHNGIDYRVAAGTPILAVADGSVLEIGNDPDGYGHYIVLGHVWGQTLYGHLSEVDVAKNAVISAGQQIALSGQSGSASAPHLHFGLRISPFSIHDGWFGFSDPLPYLTRITQARGPIMGPHLVGRIDLELLKKWQPRMLLVLDPNPDEMLLVRQACPNTTIIARVFATDHEIAERIRSGPRAAARWAHDKTMERMNPHVDYWQFANEVLQRQDELPLLNQFEMERMRLADAEGYKCAILAFSVGNPDLPEDGRMDCWEKVYPAIEHAEAHEHVVAVHQYGMPDLLGPEGLADWLILRLEHQVLMRLPYKKVKFAVTEYGIDGLIQGPSPSGWKHFTNAEDYAAQLMRNGQYLERFSGRILGYAVFTMGHFSPWGSYDIMGAVARILAEQSDRGAWSDVKIMSNALGATPGDTVTTPGIGQAIDSQDSTTEGSAEDSTSSVNEDSASSAISTEQGDAPHGTTDSTPTFTTTLFPSIERRISDNISALNGRICPIPDRPDVDISSLQEGDIVYMIRDVFTTRNGSWEVSNDAASVTQWARDAYLKPFGAEDWFDDAGADHHLFGAVLGLDGELIRDKELLFWSDGIDRLGDDEYDGYSLARTKSGSGWANQPMSGGSSYVPERGESGPWCVMPSGIAEVYVGAGLPANHHVSTFVVWQAVRLTEAPSIDIVDETETQPDTGTVVGTPPDPISPQPEDSQTGDTDTDSTPLTGETPPATKPVAPSINPSDVVSQRLGDWIAPFNISVRKLNDRPDAPSVLEDEEIVYVLKDLFTTRDGSWDPSDKPGAITRWAREYLKPLGASDYFDDAGGDRHLFAAVLDLDGTLIPNKQIAYWSDGVDMLGDPNYQGYVYRRTKDKSGWINIPIGPGSNFVPERGESGPWCWAPTGAADVVCGGGLPAKQHVSTFAVWQAVRKSDLMVKPEQGTTDEGQPTDNSGPIVGDGGGSDGGGSDGGGSQEIGDPSGIEETGTDQSSIDQSDSGQTTIFMPFVSTGTRGSQSAQVPAQAVSVPPAEAMPSTESTEDGSPLSDGDLEKLRSNAWGRAGVEYDADSPLTVYARQNNLGMPATDKFELENLIVQGYANGIVFASKDELSNIKHIAW